MKDHPSQNLDGFFSASDLRAHLKALSYAPRAYRSYGHAKARAMEARICGAISEALRHEHNAELYYAAIPSAWKW